MPKWGEKRVRVAYHLQLERFATLDVVLDPLDPIEKRDAGDRLEVDLVEGVDPRIGGELTNGGKSDMNESQPSMVPLMILLDSRR